MSFHRLCGPHCIFRQMILRKIINIVATRCQILRLKYTKFDFGWDPAPDPAGGAYSAPPNPLAGFKGLLLWEGRREKGRGGKRKGGEGMESEGRKYGVPPHILLSNLTTDNTCRKHYVVWYASGCSSLRCGSSVVRRLTPISCDAISLYVYPVAGFQWNLR